MSSASSRCRARGGGKGAAIRQTAMRARKYFREIARTPPVDVLGREVTEPPDGIVSPA